jgi:pimeloyl-ACP methyl ester carboxylesterase
VQPPETRYARSGNVNIAYQVVGEGTFDLVYVPGWVSNIEMMWEEPSLALFLRRLASFSRLVLFDKRGTGLSDRVANDELPTLEQRMDDLRAVMDEVRSERAVLFGHSEGGNMCLLFAATHPERTIALITIGIYAKRLRSDDYPWAPTPEEREAEAVELEKGWGTAVDLGYYAPSRVGDERFRSHLAAYLRRSASPGAAAALLRMNSNIDVRDVLPTIRVPTLVMHETGDRDVHVEEGRYIASRIPGATFVELPGDDHLFWVAHADAVADEIEAFLTGVRPLPQPDRVLATVLFTDVVGSTEKAVALGDRRWKALLESHDAIAAREIERFRGERVKATGDGVLATFDGPARALRCAVAMGEAVRGIGLELRAGLHTGECELRPADVAGIAVHTAARIAALAGPGEILASSTVKDLVAGSGIEFEDRGVHELKGVPGGWRLFAVSGV